MILPGASILEYVSNSQALDKEYSMCVECCLFLSTEDISKSWNSFLRYA